MSYLMPEAVDVIIVGGGFSGITLAFNLTKCNPDLEIVIARSPKGPRFGVAYETDFEAHLLNVPAKGMSAFPDLPHDFVEWAHQQGLPLEPNSFAPRKLYRQYLEDLLKEITAGGKVRLLEKEVTNVTKSPKGWQVEFSDGTLMSASQITLAFGGFPPAHVPETRSVTRHPAFVENPWTEIDRCRLAYAEKVAIIGAGLTAIDVILSCENLGFEGTYTLHSRRGVDGAGSRPQHPTFACRVDPSTECFHPSIAQECAQSRRAILEFWFQLARRHRRNAAPHVNLLANPVS